MERLKVIQAYANIFAAIAVPVVIAIFGWLAQVKQSDDTTRAEYVKMALGILTKQVNNEDHELRQWALAVLNERSPVPFTKSIGADLLSGRISIIPAIEPPAELMRPPAALIPLTASDGSDAATNGDLARNLLENMYVCKDNANQVEALQQLVTAYSETLNSITEPMRALGATTP